MKKVGIRHGNALIMCTAEDVPFVECLPVSVIGQVSSNHETIDVNMGSAPGTYHVYDACPADIVDGDVVSGNLLGVMCDIYFDEGDELPYFTLELSEHRLAIHREGSVMSYNVYDDTDFEKALLNIEDESGVSDLDVMIYGYVPALGMS